MVSLMADCLDDMKAAKRVVLSVGKTAVASLVVGTVASLVEMKEVA